MCRHEYEEDTVVVFDCESEHIEQTEQISHRFIKVQ
jgi:hypothetical protein